MLSAQWIRIAGEYRAFARCATPEVLRYGLGFGLVLLGAWLAVMAAEAFSYKHGAWRAFASGSGAEGNVVGIDFLVAGSTDDLGIAAMGAVAESDWGSIDWRVPAVAPRGQCHEDRRKFKARFGEGVFDTSGVVAISVRSYDVAIYQRGEPVCQEVSADSEILNQFVESAYANEQVAKDQW